MVLEVNVTLQLHGRGYVETGWNKGLDLKVRLRDPGGVRSLKHATVRDASPAPAVGLLPYVDVEAESVGVALTRRLTGIVSFILTAQLE